MYKHSMRAHILSFKFLYLLLDTLIMEMCAGLSSLKATPPDQRENTYTKNTAFHLLSLPFK